MNFQHNGKEISKEEREKFIEDNDKDISVYIEGLSMLKENIEILNDKDDEFSKAYRTVLLVYQFVVITLIDCMVICKYFLLADKDYDKRFMRGKMKVILNEGFKRLYGFKEESRKNTEWRKLITAVELCPEVIKRQYAELSKMLQIHSETSYWWKDERNLETHLDAERLYESRCEEIIESKVVMDATKLFSTLLAIQLFLTNVHACFHNTILKNYRDQEMKNGDITPRIL